MDPGRFTAIPSASVTIAPGGMGWLAYGAQAAISTPTTRTSGCSRRSRSRSRSPARRRPTARRRGAGQPRPRRARGRASPVRRRPPDRRRDARRPCQRSRLDRVRLPHRSSTEWPTSTTVAPNARLASVFVIDAPSGTKISHGTPSWRAAHASACAWFPALPATTPRRASAPSSASLARVPRILKLPVRCRFSAFSTTCPPQRSDNIRLVISGVRRTTPSPATRAAAIRSGAGPVIVGSVGRPVDDARRTVPRCLTITHAELGSAGFVGDELERQGYRLEPVHRDGRLEWPSTAGVELVLVLGSTGRCTQPRRSRTSTAKSPQSARLTREFRSSGSASAPQVLAAALGGEVKLAEQLELGWQHVDSLHPAIEPGPWMQWHRDTFTVPAGVEVLARSASGPQAVRARAAPSRSSSIRKSTRDRGVVGRRRRRPDLNVAGIDATALVDAPTARRRARSRARQLVRWFCAHVAA